MLRASAILCFASIGALAPTLSAPLGAQLPSAPGSQPALEGQRCAALLRFDFEAVSGLSARVTTARMVDVPQSPANAPPGSPAMTLAKGVVKRFCQVTGYVAPQNKFELRLPRPSEWNDKLFFSTCAGFCGAVNGNACVPTLARGYASVTSNGGHDGAQNFDGVWAAGSPALQQDFGWRGTHLVTLAAKSLVQAYYGHPQSRAYIGGCSKGGQAVLAEVQRFPQDFDGAIAIAPVYAFTGRVLASALAAQLVSDGQGESRLDDVTASIVHKSVLERCGAQSGVDEGMVTDPLSCDWQPQMTACKTSDVMEPCLTTLQIGVVSRLLQPLADAKGKFPFPYPDLIGTESNWAGWYYPANSAGSFDDAGHYRLSREFLRYMADSIPHTDVDPLTVDVARAATGMARARSIYDATSYDFRAFKARGGRLIVWHGLADASMPATASMALFDSVSKRMGGRAATIDFFRLFLVPGVNHCGGGPGPDDVDALSALEAWVEHATAPDVIVARHLMNGVVDRTRPVYPYPVLARYSGSGNPKDASSFVPAEPQRRR